MIATIGQRIEELRKDNGLSQQKLADDIGITRQLLSMIEIDKRVPSIEVLNLLSKRLNVSVYTLITGNSDNNHVVCEELGLSSKTVDTLRKWHTIDDSGIANEYSQGVIDILVANPELLYAIGNYFKNDFDSMMFCNFGKEKKQPVFLHLSDDTNITPDDYERMTRLKLLDGLKAVRDDLRGGKTK